MLAVKFLRVTRRSTLHAACCYSVANSGAHQERAQQYTGVPASLWLGSLRNLRATLKRSTRACAATGRHNIDVCEVWEIHKVIDRHTMVLCRLFSFIISGHKILSDDVSWK